MIFTGSELTVKRNFYTQTGAFGFGAACIVDNTTGIYRFGITGAQGSMEFKLQSGRMYYQNQFVHAYESNTEFLIEAQFTSGYTNVIKDGAPLVYADRKVTGAFDYFYFARENAGMNATFDLNVSGQSIPTYSITSNGYLTNTGQAAVTGYFVNTSLYPIRVFDSQMQASQNYSFGKLVGAIPGGGTGTFAFTGDWTTFDTSDPILTTFNENFGDVSVLFQILNVASYSRFVQFTGPTDFSFNSTGILNRNLTYLNFSGGFAGATYPAILTFSLEYVSGSGLFVPPGEDGVAYSTLGYGNFSKSGFLTGFATTVTGSFPVSQFAWATGAVTGFFSGLGTGLASGLGYTGIAAGQYTGLYSGTIFNGSGTLLLNSLLVGNSMGGFNTFVTGGKYATGYLDVGSLSEDFDSFGIYSISGTSVSVSAGPTFDAPICDSTNPSSMVNSYNTPTQFVQCFSGVPSARIGASAILVGSSKIYFTSLTPGTGGNNILLQDFGLGSPIPGAGNLIGGSVGETGGMIMAPLSLYTGAPGLILTGSGNYQGLITGGGGGAYIKTFTGSWDFLSGVDSNSLVSMRGTNQTMMSGSGAFPPNSQMVFQVTHNIIDANQDSARLIISGSEVLNPIVQLLTN